MRGENSSQRLPLHRASAAFFISSLILILTLRAKAGNPELDRRLQNAIDQVRPDGAAFCYLLENQVHAEGVNPRQKMRIASVMKLMTTSWALSIFGPEFRFRTRIYYSPLSGEMYIDGNRDPFVDRDRLYFLISELNRIGVSKVSRLTFNRGFYFNLDLFEFDYVPNELRKQYMYNEEHVNWLHTDQRSRDEMREAFNTDWFTQRKSRYEALRRRVIAQVNLSPELVFSVGSVEISDTNPLAGRDDVIEYEISSLPLWRYLKYMNMWSLNPVADEVFLAMGGADDFKTFMSDKFNSNDAFSEVYTGSGLPLLNPRRDTAMSCEDVLVVLRELEEQLITSQQVDLAKVMMVAGIDRGTWGSSTESMLAKSGTLSFARNAAGVLQARAAKIYFGAFFHTSDIGGATSAIRDGLAEIFAQYEGASHVYHGRRPYDFMPLDREMRLKRVNRSSVLNQLQSGVELRPVQR